MAKKSVPDMISGMGMATRFLTDLIAEIERQGGCPEMFYFLTTHQAHRTIAEIAEVITNAEWQAPASLIRSLAFKHHLMELGNEKGARRAAQIDWDAAFSKLHVPLSRQLSKRVEHLIVEAPGSFDNLLPTEVFMRLHGKPAYAGTPVMWGGYRHIATSFGRFVEEKFVSPEPGEIIDMNTIDQVTLVPIDYINLDA